MIALIENELADWLARQRALPAPIAGRISWPTSTGTYRVGDAEA
jgi:hypothetical protein